VNALQIRGYLVTDKDGYESLHREHSRADTYAIDHLRGGIVEPLVALSAVAALIAEMFEQESEEASFNSNSP
jgi:hypothetical protein